MRLEQATEATLWLYWSALLLLALALCFTALQVGISTFSTDSWSYFELAKTVFGDDFYRTNTIRSYFSTEYSASFPFAFPILLAVVHKFVGAQPMAAVWTNIALALGTGVVAFRLSHTLRLSNVAGALLASSVVLYEYYLDEVFAGRSMPLAIFLFFLGWYCCVRDRAVIAGVCLGLAVLARFDFLVYALLFQALWLLQPTTRLSRWMLVLVAFVSTLFPWVYYSISHFGVMWASDNTWVAASALPAFVADYPAASTVTAADNPALWLQKVVGNVPGLLREGARAALASPGLLILLAAACFNLKEVTRGAGLAIFYALAALAIALAPYLVTGYFDNRYFISSIGLGTLFLVWRIEAVQRFSVVTLNRFAVLVIALLANTLTGVSDLIKDMRTAHGTDQEMAIEAQAIGRIADCHADTQQQLLIFAYGLEEFAAKYGALTGMRAALTPSNFANLSDEMKARYFDAMRPFVLIESLSDHGPCHRIEYQ